MNDKKKNFNLMVENKYLFNEKYYKATCKKIQIFTNNFTINNIIKNGMYK